MALARLSLSCFVLPFTAVGAEATDDHRELVLFGTVLIYFLAYSTSVSLALHASRYFWKLDPFAIQLVLLSTALGPLLGAPISAVALTLFQLLGTRNKHSQIIAELEQRHASKANQAA